MSYTFKKIACIICAIGVIFTATAQQEQPAALKQYQKTIEFLLKDAGKWKAKNKKFNAADEASPSYLGYEYKQGINAHTLHIKLTGYFPKRSQWVVLWEGFYTWDIKKQKIVYHGIGNDGALATGQSESISSNELVFIYNTTYPDGKVEKQRDIEKIGNDNIELSSFRFVANKWEVIVNNTNSWSRLEQPTGNLTFMSTRDGNFEIYSMDARGENLKNLSCNKATDYAFSYAGDGRLVYYSNRDGNDEVYVLEADGKKQTNITNNAAADRIPNFSPDGKQIVFVSDRDHKQGEIYTTDADGKNVKRLTSNAYFEDAGCFSPDGKKIIFSRELKDLQDTSSKAVGNGEIFIMDADGTNERQITNRPGYDGGPQFSPDGSKIAFYGKTADGNYEIFLMDADGKNIINLTEDALEDYSPSWSPDGKWIAYTNGNSKNYDVWLIHLETKIKTRLTTQPKRDESPFWQLQK